MRIFLSYASEDKDLADNIYLSLVKNHKVFFDHTQIKGGEDFDTRIRAEIMKCDLFIFLISPDSISRSSYALTELIFVRERWNHPEGHVLPVMVRETTFELIPPYLKAVSILKPQGDTVAEVKERVRTWGEKGLSSKTWAYLGAAFATLFLLFSIVYGAYKFGSLGNSNSNSQPTSSPTPLPSASTTISNVNGNISSNTDVNSNLNTLANTTTPPANTTTPSVSSPKPPQNYSSGPKKDVKTPVKSRRSPQPVRECNVFSDCD